MYFKDILPFLKSDKESTLLSQRDKKSTFLYKKEYKNANIVYVTDASTPFDSMYLNPIFMTDKDGNIIYIHNLYMTSTVFDEGEANYIYKNIHENIKNFKNSLKEEVAKYLNDNKDKYLICTEEETERYKKMALEKYINNEGPYFSTYFEQDMDKWEFCYEFYFNKETFRKQLIEDSIKENELEYKEYVNISKEYEILKSNQNIDENAKFKNKILDILKNKAYKNIKVFYKAPNGETIQYDFDKSQDRYSLDSIKRAIIMQDRFNSIPVFAIQKICWSRSTLVNIKDYNIEYNEKQLKEEFIKLGNVGHFPKEYYKDAGFVKSLIKKNKSNVAFISNELYNNKNFMLDLVDLLKGYNYLVDIFKNMSNELKLDKDIIKKYLLNFSENNKKYFLRIKDLPEEYYNTAKYTKIFIENGCIFDYSDVIDLLDPVIFKDKEIADFFNKNKLSYVSNNIVQNLPIEQLENFFTEEAIAKKFALLNWATFSTEQIMKYITNKNFTSDNLFDDTKGMSIIDYFLEDENNLMLYNLACGIKNRLYAEKFCEKLGINIASDNQKIIPFCSYSSAFMDLLTHENIKNFLESEFENVVDIQYNDELFIVSTDYNVFTFDITSEDYGTLDVHSRQTNFCYTMHSNELYKDSLKLLYNAAKTKYGVEIEKHEDLKNIIKNSNKEQEIEEVEER